MKCDKDDNVVMEAFDMTRHGFLLPKEGVSDVDFFNQLQELNRQLIYGNDD